MMYRVSGEELWLGNVGDVWDVRPLLNEGIQAVLDLALNEPPPKMLPREVVYCRLPLVDGAGNPTWLLRAAVELAASLIRSRTPTLIYCSVGLSRTPAVAAAALAVARGSDPRQCLDSLVRDRPHDVSPGLWQDVLALLPARPAGA
jgi:protein-tyrosine phosphatase